MASLELYRRKERFAETTEELSDIVGRMIALLRFENADVYSICQEVFSDKYPKFSSITAGDFPTLWKSACQSLGVDTETTRLFALVGDTLGTSDTQSQIEQLQIIRDDMRAHAKSLKERSAETKKLYTTLGALLGLAASIIII